MNSTTGTLSTSAVELVLADVVVFLDRPGAVLSSQTDTCHGSSTVRDPPTARANAAGSVAFRPNRQR
jgi:hypothetical protein